MPAAMEAFPRCDDLDSLPEPHRRNYLAESDLLNDEIPHGASVLQVGSMDGRRIIRLSRMRPDLRLTGLDIDAGLVSAARRNAEREGVDAAFVLGDVVCPPPLGPFDYVVCLNNTLAYIDDDVQAIDVMKRLGHAVVVSVYGERFDDDLATAYFTSLGLTGIATHPDRFVLADFGTVRRYDRTHVAAWGGDARPLPIGYWTRIR